MFYLFIKAKEMKVLLFLLSCICCTIMPDALPEKAMGFSYRSDEPTTNSREIWLTVLIHGTIGLRNGLSFSTCIKLIKDDIDNTLYKEIVAVIRDNPFFFCTQPMQELGLKKINLIDPRAESAAALFAQILDKVSRPATSTLNYYYTFGWSGLLSHAERTKEADILYEALYQEYDRLTRQYPDATVHVRVMGYSHGGSVGLNLATAHQKRGAPYSFYIDELVLVATPVQNETANCIYEPLFKKVYHFYSKKDVVQKLDCFSTKRFFSQRRFKKTHSRELPEKLVQVEIKIKSPRNPEQPHCCRVDRSPRHSEFWFFGWTPTSYRDTFPLYPLPTSTILPSVIELINEYMPQEPHVIVELQPSTGSAILRKRHCTKQQTKVPWISVEELIELKIMTDPYFPDDLMHAAHHAHLNSAVNTVTGPLSTKRRKRHCCLIGINDMPQS